MKEKVLTKRVSYLPQQELIIDGIQPNRQWLNFTLPLVFVFLFAILVNIAPILVLPLFISSTFLAFREGRKIRYSQLLRFEPKRLYILSREHDSSGEQNISYPLKTPLFLDIIVKTKKDLLNISFEQYGKSIGNTTVTANDLPTVIDSLRDFYGLEIYDSRSTVKSEVLLLRPKNLDENLMLSYIRVTEDGLRLIVNPTSNRHNFMVNFQRRIIKTAKNKIIAIDDINKITFWIKKNKIIVNLALLDNSIQLLIDFKTKNYQDDIITNDIKSLVRFLESKDIFQNIIFEVAKY